MLKNIKDQGVKSGKDPLVINAFNEVLDDMRKEDKGDFDAFTKISCTQYTHELYQSIFISFGQHPEYVNNNNIVTAKDIVSISKNNNVIGIGETGIDLYHSTEHIKSQYKSFENHIEACLETNLPLIVHQRNSEKEIIDILSNYKNNYSNTIFYFWRWRRLY